MASAPFCIALICQLVIVVGYFWFYRKEQLGMSLSHFFQSRKGLLIIILLLQRDHDHDLELIMSVKGTGLTLDLVASLGMRTFTIVQYLSGNIHGLLLLRTFCILVTFGRTHSLHFFRRISLCLQINA